MRVNNVYLTNPLPGQSELPTAALDASQPSAGVEQAQQEVSAHVPSPELVQLVGQVRQTSEVRTDRIAEVSQRLASGFYNTSAAAEQTAQAMLDADD